MILHITIETEMSNGKSTPLSLLHFFFLLKFLLMVAFIFNLPLALSITDQSDVQALGVMYTSLSSPSQLTGWNGSGGDPCGEGWRGITCEGSVVVSVQISGLGLGGVIGYLLSNLKSLRTLDLSRNHIEGSIPYQLPPNLTSLNFAGNNFTGNLPYSISSMIKLNYMNLSHNELSDSIGDIFANLSNLASLDLSFNNFSGDLPDSFCLLSRLSSLYMQHNRLTGTLNVLAGLHLNILNVANNDFSGWIPHELSSVPNFIHDGNSFFNDFPAQPLYKPTPPASRSRGGDSISGPGESASEYFHHQSLLLDDGQNQIKALLLIAIFVLCFVFIVALIILVLCARKCTRKDTATRTSAGTHSASIDGVKLRRQKNRPKGMSTAKDKKPFSTSAVASGQRSGYVKRLKSPVTATSYTVASLQAATNSFSQEFLIGEGSLGRVYRAEFPNGKVMAIKKIDNAALSLQEEDQFLEAVSNMSRLRHGNIVTLVGYCAEHGQRLLVYEYIENGSLHEMLYLTDDSSSKLSWKTRVRIALSSARALEYLHEVCLPPVVHRNFKSANILLDQELNPYLSDCGLASLTANKERQVMTRVVGSFGYSAPEFALSGTYTVKSDVYSFGVVMLELLTGRKPLDSSRTRTEQPLLRWAAPRLQDIDALENMVDPALKGMYPAKSLCRFGEIIAQCVQPEPESRPQISEVVQALIRLMQRANVVRRRYRDESGYKTPDIEVIDVQV